MKNNEFFRNIKASSKSLQMILATLSIILTLFAALAIAPFSFNATAQVVTPLDPLTIPKYVNQITGPPPMYVPTVVTDGAGNVIRHDYNVTAAEHMQQVLPAPLPMTKVWGYAGQAKDAVTGAPLGYILNAPGPTFNETKGIPVKVKWINSITTPYFVAVDPTLHMANPNNMPMPTNPFNAYPSGYAQAQSPVPIVTHLHGGEISSKFDGGPDAWWTANGIHGPGYNTYEACAPNEAVYYYENINQEATLWYHDHSLGVTRLNTISGLAGFYYVTDPANPTGVTWPTGKYDVPLAIQDRIFNTDGSLNFPSTGVNPTIHPYWIPEFFGDVIMVNGLVWPNMNVDQAAYRFRLLDGSNARFYTISFVTGFGTPSETALPFTVISTDQGYLSAPVQTTSFTFSPGERVEILMDFSGVAAGTQIIMKNTANENFPNGAPVNPATVGQIMQFTVGATVGTPAPTLPTPLNPLLPTYPTIPATTNIRRLTLIELLDPTSGAPLELLLDGQRFAAPASEIANVGSIEEWRIVNPTADAHPIHTHLIQMQIISRQTINTTAYMAAWDAANGPPPLTKPTIPIDVTPYLLGTPVLTPPEEQSFDDTVMMMPDEVTIVRVRYAPSDMPMTGPGAPTPGVNPYPFDPAQGPGYVWHCHILDHEDNEMMRPLLVSNIAPPPTNIAPETTLNLYGTLVNGIYSSDVTVELIATRNTYRLDHIEYSFDNIHWTRYYVPFVVSTQGSNTIYYKTYDTEGYTDSVKSATFIVAGTASAFDFGTVGSPVAAGYTQVTQATAYSVGTGYGWSSITGLQSRDRGAPDDLRRDFVFANTDRFFNVDVTNGAYDVTIIIGDNSFAHDLIDIIAEATLINQVTTPAGTFTTLKFTVTVADSQFNLQLHDAGGADPNWVINSIVIAPASTAKTFDFGTANSPLFDGYDQVTQTTAYSASMGYGWASTTGLGSRDRTVPDDFRRDFVFASTNNTFNIDLANGAYTVTVVIGDNNFAHDLINVLAEGTLVVNQISVAGATFATQTFTVTVADGQLNLLLHDAGGTDPNWVINAITVIPA